MGNPKSVKSKLRQAVIANTKCALSVTEFSIPDLRIGTLDQLMKSSDELQKIDQQAEQVAKKIERSVYDLLDNRPVKDKKKKKGNDKKRDFGLQVSLDMGPTQGSRQQVNLAPNKYINSFKWDRL